MVTPTVDAVDVGLAAAGRLFATAWFAWAAGTSMGLSSGFALGVWLDALVRRRNQEHLPLLDVTFDVSNDGDFSWFQDEFLGEQVTQYCLKVTNNTDETVDNVEAMRLRGPNDCERAKFIFSGITVTTLYPGASDYIRVAAHNARDFAALCEVNGGKPKPYTFDVCITSPDARALQKTVAVDFSKVPAISLLR